jgi:hypothetical protein
LAATNLPTRTPGSDRNPGPMPVVISTILIVGASIAMIIGAIARA